MRLKIFGLLFSAFVFSTMCIAQKKSLTQKADSVIRLMTLDEKIGQLNYSSAYQPIYNSKNKLLGYINLQHFGQQREFENQIQKVLLICYKHHISL